ncbi:MAG: Integrase catalytic region [Rubritepida sp.]|nr:Integrase catalytic region [Rubritepida sp.]
MIAFIDDHRGVYGVEPLCKVLPIAPSTYHAHAARRLDPSKLPARAKHDAALMPQIRRVFEENFRVYGVRKIWRQLLREGHGVARCTVARLMPNMGLQGVIRGKPVRTTTSDKAAPKHVEITSMRIARQRRLHLQGQAVHAPTHVRVTGGKPDPHAGRNWDHRRNADNTRRSAAASTS